MSQTWNYWVRGCDGPRGLWASEEVLTSEGPFLGHGLESDVFSLFKWEISIAALPTGWGPSASIRIVQPTGFTFTEISTNSDDMFCFIVLALRRCAFNTQWKSVPFPPPVYWWVRWGRENGRSMADERVAQVVGRSGTQSWVLSWIFLRVCAGHTRRAAVVSCACLIMMWCPV